MFIVVGAFSSFSWVCAIIVDACFDVVSRGSGIVCSVLSSVLFSLCWVLVLLLVRPCPFASASVRETWSVSAVVLVLWGGSCMCDLSLMFVGVSIVMALVCLVFVVVVDFGSLIVGFWVGVCTCVPGAFILSSSANILCAIGFGALWVFLCCWRFPVFLGGLLIRLVCRWLMWVCASIIASWCVIMMSSGCVVYLLEDSELVWGCGVIRACCAMDLSGRVMYSVVGVSVRLSCVLVWLRRMNVMWVMCLTGFCFCVSVGGSGSASSILCMFIW